VTEIVVITLDQFEHHEVETIMSGVLTRLHQMNDVKPYEIASLELEVGRARRNQGGGDAANQEVDLVRHLSGFVALLQTRDLSRVEYGLIEDLAQRYQWLILTRNGVDPDEIESTFIEGSELVCNMKGSGRLTVH
jgi:hypothetical protein